MVHSACHFLTTLSPSSINARRACRFTHFPQTRIPIACQRKQKPTIKAMRVRDIHLLVKLVWLSFYGFAESNVPFVRNNEIGFTLIIDLLQKICLLNRDKQHLHRAGVCKPWISTCHQYSAMLSDKPTSRNPPLPLPT